MSTHNETQTHNYTEMNEWMNECENFYKIYYLHRHFNISIDATHKITSSSEEKKKFIYLKSDNNSVASRSGPNEM